MQVGSAAAPEINLTDELARGRGREAATREILEVISRSRDDDRPVFDAILHQAASLCHADGVALILGKKGDAHPVIAAMTEGIDHAPIAIYARGEVPMDAEFSYAAKAILTGDVVHIADMMDTDGYRQGVRIAVSAVDDAGIRTAVFVPLLTADGGIGCLNIFRKEVRPYATDEIALVETFAAQAVIAIENVRQFRELQERLEREAATREILEVISQSRDDDRPVFHAILRNAIQLCKADMAGLHLARRSDSHIQMTAGIGWSEDSMGSLRVEPIPMDRSQSFTARSILDQVVIHIPDLAKSDLYLSGVRVTRIAVDEAGVRAMLLVPLLQGDEAIGAIALDRLKPEPFSPSQIDLVKSFAAQAVIAIENVRQFRELQSRLAREAATREILEVISQSRDDDKPVFDVVLRKAAELCSASMANLEIISEDRSHAVMLAHWGEVLRHHVVGTTSWPMESELANALYMKEGRIVHVRDLADTDLYRSGDPIRVADVEKEGIRTFLAVPLFSGGRAVGCIALYRREVSPFSADDIVLVETFAAQAVIAIENVRQFKALEALNAELGDRVEVQVGEIERMGRLKRFLPAAVADAVVSSGSERMLSSHRALLGVLFCDMRGFTAFCETAEPEETIEVLQTYHEEMGKLINAHGAGVDHRTGDGIMVLFNDPLPCDDPAGEAVRLALAMRARMTDLGQQWKRLGHKLGFGVGISLGYATVGMVGFEGRFDYTASGTAINLASRLCDEALDGEILLSPRARIAVEDRFPVESRGEVTLKGIREPVEVFRLAGIAAA